MMTAADVKYCLRDLGELDIENLATGRITRQALIVCLERFSLLYDAKKRIATLGHDGDMWIAEELSDMIAASKQLMECSREELSKPNTHEIPQCWCIGGARRVEKFDTSEIICVCGARLTLNNTGELFLPWVDKHRGHVTEKE